MRPEGSRGSTPLSTPRSLGSPRLPRDDTCDQQEWTGMAAFRRTPGFLTCFAAATTLAAPDSRKVLVDQARENLCKDSRSARAGATRDRFAAVRTTFR